MGALLYWLHAGLAIYLAFAPPVIRAGPTEVDARLETKRVLTEEMRELVIGGVRLDFELYVSLHTEGPDGKPDTTVRKIRRNIGYDYVRMLYNVEEDGKNLFEGKTVDEAEEAIKRYDGIAFSVPEGWKRASLFAQLRVLDNAMLRDSFGKSGADLWNGYSPSVSVDFANSGRSGR